MFHPSTKTQGVKLTFFPGSHLAPKYFKVVANSKELVAMTHTKPFLPCHCTRSIKLLKIRTSYKEDTRMNHIQCQRLPKCKMASSDDRFTFQIVHVLRFENELTKELCGRFIFTNLQQSLDL